ncbi:MAG: CHAT domain-containing protein, partial [Spirulina sp.]
KRQIQNILARVAGGNPSFIDGLIQVTGGNANLYLMNPAGIVFGSNASLNVSGDFFATTATGIGLDGGIFNAFGSNDYLALNGVPSTFEFNLENPAPLVNAGNLTVNPGRNIGLMGGSVINTGTLSAPGGNILISAIPGTRRVKISRPGGLLSLDIEVPFSKEGKPLPVNVLDLPKLLVGAEEQEVTTGLNMSSEGNIFLDSQAIAPPDAGTALVMGTLDVRDLTGNAKGEQSIYVLGDRVGVLNAQIDASGVNSGGNLFLGGDYQGKGAIPNAEFTWVDDNTAIRADALSFGNGGRVIVWADDTTKFAGNISARGGVNGGNGGFVEVSGQENLHFAGLVDTSAPLGEAGMLLLDPTDITIVTGGTPDPGITGDPKVWAFADNPGSQSIGVEVIRTLLLSSSVTLQATNDITWDTGVTLDYNGIGFGTKTLTLEANNNIDFQGKIYDSDTAVISEDSLNVTFSADTDGNQAGYLTLAGTGIETRGGHVNLQGNNNTAGKRAVFVTGNINSSGNSSNGNINIAGNDINNGGKAGIEITGNLNSGGGTINLTGTSAKNDGVDLNGGTLSSGGGNITISGTNADPAETGTEDQGVDIDGAVNSGGGAITIDGTSGLIGVDVGANGSLNSGGGAIAITGTATGTDVSRKGILVRNIINAGAGDITLTSDRPNISHSVSGTGTLFLKPKTAGQPLILGGGGDIDATFLNTTELGNLGDGFSSIQVGDPALSSIVELLAPGSFNDPLTIQNASLLKGPLADTNWTLTGNQQGSISGYANPITFSDVATIRGNSFQDTFVFSTGVNFNGFIDGGAGIDTLDYSGYGGAATVDLAGGTATGTTGINRIENAIVPPPVIAPPTPPAMAPPTSPVVSSPTNSTSDPTITLPSISDIEHLQEIQPLWSSWHLEQEGKTMNWVDRQRIISLLDTGDLKSAIALLDQYYSQKFLGYLGKETTASAYSFRDLRDALERMAVETGKSTAVLYIFTRDRRLDLILVPPTADPIHYTVDVPRPQLFAEMGNFQYKLSHPVHRRNTQYLAPSQQLYQWLIDPAREDLQRLGIEGIAFVLDEGLRTLPMAALHNGKEFLVENYAISLLPSFQLIPHRYADMRRGAAIAMGMSEFTQHDPLPAVPVEVATIAEQFPTQPMFLNETFTANAVRHQPGRSGSNIVHLATHGQFQPGTPSESYIQLWDRKLSLADMGTLDWQDIELLVLSACRTALGDETAEYGFAGLSVQAGVSSAVASLWYASDTGTLALMSEFYQQLRSRETKAEALRQAQMAMIAGKVRLEKASGTSDRKAIGQLVGTLGRVDLPSELETLSDRAFQHPYYWSGFTLIGSPW